MYNTQGLIPAKFLTLVAHLALGVSILWSSQQSVKACLPEIHSPESYHSQHTQLILGISLSLGLIVFELFAFLTGLTMFHTTSALLSIGSHGSACLVLCYLIFDGWQCGWYWIIFGFCSLFPALNDITIIGDIVINKKY